ncbi:hypothetical protein CR983_01840 [Candidatus Saccharibacteria bacterium]|nr:MAG: hypothetical protein CR983_01840 [Candidatus Saccharibacteria bacterium]
MKTALRIILVPVIFVLSILTLFLEFIFNSIFLRLLSLLIMIGAIACFVEGMVLLGWIALFVSFLLSPYGLPMASAAILEFVKRLKDNLESV